MQRPQRILIISTGSLLLLVIVIIGFISSITKYVIEKYDEQYTGRQITMDWAYVNPFTGYIHFSGLQIYEQKSDSIFLSANGLSVNLAILKLLSKEYELSEVILYQPKGIIIQREKVLNFSDLIELFSPDSLSTQPPVHVNICHVQIIDGEFHYREKLIPINYFIKHVSLESSGKQWDADTIATQFSFIPGIGTGDIKGNFTINIKNNDYRVAFEAQKFDLKLIEQYIRGLANYGSFRAHLDANIRASGNLNDQENITAAGLIVVNDFHFGKDSTDDYASFERLKMTIQELSPINHKYLIDSLILNHPYLKYERYDHLDNLQTMFGKGGANITAAAADNYKFNLVIEVARYIKVLSKNFLQSDYKINRVSVHGGNLKFNDFSLTEKFSANLNPLMIHADSIDSNHQRVNINLQSDVKPYGNVVVSLGINPKDSGDFDIQYKLQKLSAAMFNPYIISYTSFPLDRGTIECIGTWNVRNSMIQSDNHLLIIDPRITTRTKNKDTKWIPMPLIMPLIRERDNFVDYSIPITGNLKNPKFHIKDIILDLLENIFIKPPTTAYGMHVKTVETELEKSLSLTWPIGLATLRPKQEKFVERMADFLTENPDANMVIHSKQYTAKEKEHILFFEAKKKYYLMAHKKNSKSFNEEDNDLVEAMSVKDESFVRYLDKEANDSLIFTVQEKCEKLIGSSIVNVKLEELEIARSKTFIAFFKKEKVKNEVVILPPVSMIPYNGFSYYKIEYKGELPEWLIKAYQDMNQLDEEPQRKKLKDERLVNK